VINWTVLIQLRLTACWSDFVYYGY